MSKYVVLKDFKDLQDNDHIYRAKAPFPREGAEVSEERIEELASNNNKRNEVLIEAVEVDDDGADNRNNGNDPDGEFPKHTGGGHYELSNGEKVKGKDAAVEAEKALQD